MPDSNEISKVKLPNGEVYDIKDDWVRKQLFGDEQPEDRETNNPLYKESL